MPLQFDDEVVETPLAEPLLDDITAARQAVSIAIRERVATARKLRFLEVPDADMDDDAFQHSLVPPLVLQTHRTLLDIGTWVTGDGRYEGAALSFEVEKMCERKHGVSNISLLASEWQRQHQAIRAAPTRRFKTPGETRCFQAGICLCQRTEHGPRRRKMYQAAEDVLKQFFRNKDDTEALKQGEVAVLWCGFKSVEEQQQHRIRSVLVTAVPLHYMRPWRPTYLLLCPVQGEFEKFEAWLQNQRSSDASGVSLICGLEVEDGNPCFATFPQLMERLDPQMRWSIVITRLSSLAKPFLNSDGLVKLILPADREVVCFWHGHSDMAKVKAISSDKEVDEPAVKDEKEEVEKDATSDGDDEKEDLADDILDVWGMLDFEQAQDNDSDSDSSSGSSGSGSSSTKTSTSNKANVDSNRTPTPRPKTSSLGEQVATAGPSTTKKRLAAEEVAPRKKTNVSESFGVHRLVPRYNNKVLTAYQLSCRCQGHERCSKELSFQVVGGAAAARKVLKAWALLGEGLPSREAHMAADLKQILMDALAANLILPEQALDDLATNSDPSHPLVPGPKKAANSQAI